MDKENPGQQPAAKAVTAAVTLRSYGRQTEFNKPKPALVLGKAPLAVGRRRFCLLDFD